MAAPIAVQQCADQHAAQEIAHPIVALYRAPSSRQLLAQDLLGLLGRAPGRRGCRQSALHLVLVMHHADRLQCGVRLCDQVDSALVWGH